MGDDRQGKKGAMTSGIVTNLVFVRAQAGKVAELEEALKELAQEARKEPGSIAYELHRSASEPDEYLVYEMWRSKGDLDAHMKAAVVQAFLARVLEFVDGASNLRLFTPVDIGRI